MRLYSINNKLNQRKKEEKRKKAFLISLIFLGVFLIIGASAWGISKIPFFKVQNIEVAGIKSPASENLTANLESFFKGEYLTSKLLGKNNMLFWKSNVNDFLKNHPEYETLVIDKDYLKHKILLEAKEREKFGIWCKENHAVKRESEQSEISSSTISAATSSSNNETFIDLEGDERNQCWWFDEEGIAFAPAPIIESELFNRVDDFSSNEISLGKKVLPDDQFSRLIKIYDILNKTKINSKTLHINELSEEEASVESQTDPIIYFSLHDDPSFAIYPIQELKNSGKWKNLQYIDLRVLNRAYYR